MKPVLNKKTGMSFVEILTSLGIISTIAAIFIPVVVDRVSDKALLTQKKAAVTVLTEATSRMTGINGYGNGNLSNAAQAFIVNGLQKSLKIRTVCDKNNLENCGLPDSFLTEDASGQISFPKTMAELYPISNGVNSDVAGFLTINGISAAAYYNPNCTKKEKYTDSDSKMNAKDKICLNMIYDVNGKKKPNRVGKDIGYITVLYSDIPEVAAPEPASDNNSSGVPDNLCRNINKAHQPNIEELVSLFMNKNLSVMKNQTGAFISSTSADKEYIFELSFSSGEIKAVKANKSGATRCIKDANRTY